MTSGVDARWFATTHWSVVLAAGRSPSPKSASALEELCRNYWYPLYAYVRRRGQPPHDAEDLTQDFFARLLEKNDLARVGPEKGKFRSFLLTSMNHFLANEWDRARALKRGGGRSFISLNDSSAEVRYSAEPASEWTPEKVFDHRWAVTLLEHALAKLREEYLREKKSSHFNLLKAFLAAEGEQTAYANAAAQLGVNARSIPVLVHRLRKRYRQLIRAEAAQTVSAPEEIDAEMKYLLATLSDPRG